jgi:hypothetical protein
MMLIYLQTLESISYCPSQAGSSNVVVFLPRTEKYIGSYRDWSLQGEIFSALEVTKPDVVFLIS